MPSETEHIAKAKHNEAFYLSFDLNKTLFLDWVVNGIFYSALHYIDSYFAHLGLHPRNHSDRINFIANDANLRNIFSKYRHLKDDSEAARYKIRHFTPDEINNSIKPLLEFIKIHLKKYVTDI